jgi:hypothetical protein
MADFNFFHTRFDQPVQIYSIERDWTKWICLNGVADLLPIDINLHKDYPERDWTNEQTLASGRYKDVEWACEPDWFRLDTWWRGWIPVAITDDFEPWYLNLDAPAPFINTATNRFAFPNKEREEMKDGLRKLQAAVECLIDECMLGSYLSGPPAYDHSILDGTFATLHDLSIENANAKRAALDRAGWIRWWMATCEDGYFITPQPLETVLRKGLNSLYDSRGFVIDLCRDWRAIDLPLWLHHHMPIFYAWGFDEQNDTRFSRMNPRLIALANGDDSSTDETSKAELDDKLVGAANDSWSYDDYLSPIVVDTTGSLSSYDSNAKHMVIDFEGWGRRLISEDQAPDYAANYHFTTSTDDATGTPIVIFFRWKPRHRIQVDANARSEKENRDRQFELWKIREIFAPSLAPTASREFHLLTGAQMRGFADSLERRLAERTWDTHSASEDSDESREDAFVLAEEERGRRSLKERLGNHQAGGRNHDIRPSLSNLTTWKNIALSSRTGRSRSPPRRSVLAGSVPLGERPAKIFRNAFKDLAGKLTFMEDLFLLARTSVWDAQFVGVGYPPLNGTLIYQYPGLA